MDYNLSVFSKFDYNSVVNARKENGDKVSYAQNPVVAPLTPAQDTFVDSKKEKLKKAGKIALLMAGIAALGVFTACKVRDKGMEKEIRALYDKMCEEASEQADKLGINFAKPELKFKRLKNELGGYYYGDNTISFNKKLLSKKNLCFTDFDSLYKNTITSKDGKSITLADTFAFGKVKKGARKASDTEYMFIMEQILGHELTHARQAQIALSCENAEELILKAIKSRPNPPKMSDSEIISSLKQTCPFIYSYKPRSILAQDTQFRVKSPAKAEMIYTPKTMINSLFNYTDAQTDKYGYYVNRAEVEARMTEAGIAQKTLKKICEKYGISDETLKKLQKSETVQEGLDEVKKLMPEDEIGVLRAILNATRAANHNISALFQSILGK